MSGLAHLADIAVNALGQKDKVIASDASAALRRLLVDYQSRKGSLEPEWFAIGAPLRADPDFVALADESLEDLARNRTWLEWKGLRQIREVFGAALDSMPEMAHVVAIDTRYVGEAALATSNREVFALTVKFMNTYLRAALNGKDVRTAYNVLNQYRQLAESLLSASAEANDWALATLVEIAGHFKYYARLAHGNGMGFVTETAAYDLCALCEMASARHAAAHDRLLAIFLEIDDRAEERALRGVRKAQAKLASFYLASGETARAQTIYEDMKNESPERLRSIRDEMLAITSKDFWEVVDRGTNFDYVSDARKEKLRQFFAKFAALVVPRRRVGDRSRYCGLGAGSIGELGDLFGDQRARVDGDVVERAGHREGRRQLRRAPDVEDRAPGKDRRAAGRRRSWRDAAHVQGQRRGVASASTTAGEVRPDARDDAGAGGGHVALGRVGSRSGRRSSVAPPRASRRAPSRRRASPC